ncbi:DUF2750 domain-containing protein [Arthrobacter sp. IA7]|nr:DUF2750 domain-containing protein [Arthrobacter ipis]
MSTSAAHVSAVGREILKNQEVWTVRAVTGYPAPVGPEDYRSMPFWSLPSRVQRALGGVWQLSGPGQCATTAWEQDPLPRRPIGISPQRSDPHAMMTEPRRRASRANL